MTEQHYLTSTRELPSSPTPLLLILKKYRIDLVCINCFVSANFDITGHISYKHLHGFEGTSITLTSQNIQAALEIEASMNAERQFPLTPYQIMPKTIIPDFGFELPGFLELGVYGELDVGASIGSDAGFDITTGFTANVPDNSQITLGLPNLDNPTVAGWDQSTFQPVFNVRSGNVSIEGALYLAPKISVGIMVKGKPYKHSSDFFLGILTCLKYAEIADIEVGLSINLPQIDLSASFLDSKFSHSTLLAAS
jgi:hypothetical protein